MPAEDVIATLGTRSTGLTSEEARARLDQHGLNEVTGEEDIEPWRIFLEQYTSALIWVLLVAAIVMWIVGHRLDAIVILGIVVIITLFGFIQDYRAERSIAALQEMSTTHTIVSRDGEKTEINARRVVPGDIIHISAGDIIPADGRLISESNLSVDESALTGESMGVSKSIDELSAATTLAERTNILHKDTVVERGSGSAVVFQTGSDTEIGSIATALEAAVDRDTPFQAEMDRLGKLIAAGVLGIVSIIMVTEILLGDTPPFDVFLTAVGIAVSAVPEGLPAVVTLALALGARRMAEKNALVRRLPIVEALGSVDVICTDKTGTLTEEEMTVTRLYANQETYRVTGTGYDSTGEFFANGEPVDFDTLTEILRCGILCNNVELGRRETNTSDQHLLPRPDEDGRVYLGDPTEIALFVASQKAGFDQQAETDRFPRIREIDFSSDRKRMTTLHESPESDLIGYMKGAPETVLERCDRELIEGEVVELTEDRRTEIVSQIDSFADDALRVMGFAYRPSLPNNSVDWETCRLESQMIFLGLQGMFDPPRSEVPGAIEACHRAGINVVMITGDNPTTARAIGKEIGISSQQVITGRELETISDQELTNLVSDVNIFARTSPNHKTRILQTLQAMGHTVAMTGDGVNDAPAVKNADVGVAMGIRGTDVTEQASDIVLLDDNFATIRDAIHGGRRIFDNVRKFVNYLLSGNGGEVTMIFAGTLAGLGLVITPLQILWINVVTDGIPALSLGVDPAADDVMDRSPRPKGEGVITKRIITSIVGISFFMAVCLLPLFSLNYTGELLPGLNILNNLFPWQPGYEPTRELAQTMVFTGFVVLEIVRIQAIRFRYGLGLFSNRWLVIAVAISFTLQLLVLYTQTGQLLFGVQPLSVVHWAQIFIAALVFTLLMAIFVRVQDRFFERY